MSTQLQATIVGAGLGRDDGDPAGTAWLSGDGL